MLATNCNLLWCVHAQQREQVTGLCCISSEGYPKSSLAFSITSYATIIFQWMVYNLTKGPLKEDWGQGSSTHRNIPATIQCFYFHGWKNKKGTIIWCFGHNIQQEFVIVWYIRVVMSNCHILFCLESRIKRWQGFCTDGVSHTSCKSDYIKLLVLMFQCCSRLKLLMSVKMMRSSWMQLSL